VFAKPLNQPNIINIRSLLADESSQVVRAPLFLRPLKNEFSCLHAQINQAEISKRKSKNF